VAHSSTLRIAWRSLGRNRRRTALALGAIAVAELAIVFYEGVVRGYTDWLLAAVTGPFVGHVQVHAPKWRDERALDLYIDDADRRLEEIRRVPGIERAHARIYGPALVAKAEEGEAAVVVGVDIAEEAQFGLLEGVPSTVHPKHGQVLVGRTLAESLGVKTGDEIAVLGQASDGSIANELYTVAGAAETPVDLVNRMGLLMPLEDARALLVMPNAAHEIVIRGKDSGEAAALAARLQKLDTLRGEEILDWRKIAPEMANVLDVMGAAELIILSLVFVAAAAGAANTMMMATFERTRELGMLLALGTRPRRIVAMVLTEGVILGVVGLLLGAAVGVALVLLFGQRGIDISGLAGEGGGAGVSFAGLRIQMLFYPRLDVAGLWNSLIAVMITSMLAALWPALRAARLEPMEAMRS
jgi:ABC-type lipoprotein release transport system permease subunit